MTPGVAAQSFTGPRGEGEGEGVVGASWGGFVMFSQGFGHEVRLSLTKITGFLFIRSCSVLRPIFS